MGLAAMTYPLAGCGDDDNAAVTAPEATDTVPAATTEATPTPKATKKAAKKPAKDAAPEATAKAEATATAKAEPTKKPEPKPTKKPAPKALKPVGEPFADASQVPVGSGALFEIEEQIVTQPKAGQFVGFTDKCTHEGCVIDVFEGAKMICTCHGAEFKITDGTVAKGPAKKTLPAKPVVEKDGKLYHAK